MNYKDFRDFTDDEWQDYSNDLYDYVYEHYDDFQTCDIHEHINENSNIYRKACEMHPDHDEKQRRSLCIAFTIITYLKFSL
uniref:Uncharacterized protein n=1 Tax=viral metagenome TaxID=1070528 RepID=A0A6C0EA82_9ZZZZ